MSKMLKQQELANFSLLICQNCSSSMFSLRNIIDFTTDDNAILNTDNLNWPL